MNENINVQNSWDVTKTVVGKLMTINIYFRKRRKILNQYLAF